ncbi:hypothetical protein LTR65_007214 [Meristemomyces frigidus]
MSKRREKRRVSMELPERFDEEDDAEEDVTGNPDSNGGYVQQSLYGLIGAAGQSKAQFGVNFQPDSGSESEGDTEVDRIARPSKVLSNTGSQASSGRPSLEDWRPSPKLESSRVRKTKLSESTLMKQFMKPIRERSDSQAQEPMSQSQFLPPREAKTEAPGRPTSASGVRSDAPVMDRMLQAKARAQMEASTGSSASGRSREGTHGGDSSNRKPHVDLPMALAEIFHFEEPEDVISEYPCWYLQSVLLQGYMYITKKHICFYAYMQKKGNVVIKSGHLGKQGKRNPRYRRYWFVLKGDVLSYFASAADPYFPNGTIELRYGISADLAPEKGQEKSKETSTFTVTTDKRTYYFKADSISSAKEWVKQLQKVIFRSHNDGDSVKISLPIANVVDVEANPVIDFAETVKLRVIDNEETYSVDEYFFTFFSFGKDAMSLINILTEDNEVRRIAVEAQDEAFEPLQKTKSPPARRSISVEKSPRLSLGVTASVSEPVRSTLSPLSVAGGHVSPRVSGEFGRSSGEVSRTSSDRGRASFDRGRRSVSATSGISSQKQSRASNSPLSPAVNQSNESFITSEHVASSPTTPGGDEIDMSASQMLTGDGAFRAPTLRMPQPRRTVSGSTVERLRRESQQLLPVQTTPTEASVRAHLPTRAQTEQMSPVAQSSTQRKAGLKLQPASASASSRPSLQVLATPLQHAYTLYGHVRSQSKRGISYLSSSPKDYLNKFSSAMAGGKRHYSEADGMTPEERIEDLEDDLDVAEHERRFQQHFALPESERLVAVFYCWLHRVLPLYGKVYIGTRNFCFRSLMYGTRTRIVIPIKNIDNLEKERGFRWGYPAMVVVIRGHEELFFDFSSNGLRDDCVVTVLRAIETVRAVQGSVILTDNEKMDADAAAAENELLQGARKDGYASHDLKLPQNVDQSEPDAPPILFDDPTASMLDFKPKQPLRITCLTIGSRGDVQPYIALCKGLLAEGHKARLATHHEFRPWVEQHGIEFVPVEGDPTELMRVCVENGMFTPSFLFEANSKFRGWLDSLLNSAYEACKGSDLLIESPSAMAGIHIAEALGIPYFRAFTMPWTRTRAYPHAFAVPNHKLGGAYNYVTYTMFDNLFWQVTAGQINRWRRKTLGLKPTSLEKLQPNKVPFLYNFSPSVVVPPLDFSDWVRVTGYWFLDEGDKWTPPNDLLDFVQKARKDNMKLVYIGFGSVTVSDSRQLTQQVVDAVVKADVRCILSKGWSDRLDKKDQNVAEVVLPPSVLQIHSAPHDWLFKQIDAAVHHGGAGTTGASLRAGVPTIIKPFFGDQFFFATRVEDLGVGVHLKKVTVNTLGRALWIATHDERMRTKARVLGEQIRREDGVATAINAIYRDLDYAKTLIKRRTTQPAGEVDVGEDEDAEESWTFVENDSDFDVAAARLGDPAAARPGALGQHGRHTNLGSQALKGRLI